MNVVKQSSTRSYSQEDVREILNIALAQHSHIGTELSYDQLLEIAQELGITPDLIEFAQSQWLDQQKVIQKNLVFQAYRRSKLQERFTKYAIINACLIALNLLTGFGVPWSLYVLLSWGIVRGVDAWRVFFQRQGYAYDRALQKWEYQQKRQNGLEA